MDLKEGDRVKFLDATGGGVVRKIIDSRMVLVAIEGGFEIPTLASNLLKMDTSEAGQRYFNEHFDVPEKEVTPVSPGPQAKPDEKMSSIHGQTAKSRKAEEVFIAFLPHDQKWLITGLVDVLLINNTSYVLLYNYLRKEEKGKYSGIDYGSVDPGSRLVLATADRENLNEWTTGCLQFLFHKDESMEVLPPFNAEFEIQGKKFYSEGSYRTSPLIDGKGIVLKVVSLEQAVQGGEKSSGKNSSGKPGERVQDDFIMKLQTADREAEVDLHMAALAETGGKYEEGKVLEFQKNYFEKALKSAILNRFRKVTFIHGVGNGILRKAISEILNKYGIIEVYDAPVSQYGTGAIEVRIPYNISLPGTDINQQP